MVMSMMSKWSKALQFWFFEVAIIECTRKKSHSRSQPKAKVTEEHSSQWINGSLETVPSVVVHLALAQTTSSHKVLDMSS